LPPEGQVESPVAAAVQVAGSASVEKINSPLFPVVNPEKFV
jgi:hypothetical protein